MKPYCPKLTYRRRQRDEYDYHRNRRAIWVKMPHSGEYNIGDLNVEELTEGVKKALEAAFERGFEARSMLSDLAEIQSTVTFMEGP